MKRLSTNIFKFKKRKNLTEPQLIELLQRLNQLLQNGFTLFESFSFLNLHFPYKNKTIGQNIIESLQTGATCYEILKIIGYPEIILNQIKFAEQYGKLENVITDSIDYMKRNYKAKKALIKTIQYPIVLISIFLVMLIVLKYDSYSTVPTIIFYDECRIIYLSKYTYFYHNETSKFFISISNVINDHLLFIHHTFK